jgi:hypothetical protein
VVTDVIRVGAGPGAARRVMAEGYLRDPGKGKGVPRSRRFPLLPAFRREIMTGRMIQIPIVNGGGTPSPTSRKNACKRSV